MMQQADSGSFTGNEEYSINQYVYDQTESDDRTSTSAKLFYFDPNTLDVAGWEKLGLRRKTIQTIINYRNKGGTFRKPADLERIYTLSNAEYKRLAPYINIQLAGAKTVYQKSIPLTASYTTTSKKSISALDINSADAAAWIALPGIGEKLAARIMNFREKLGGFHTVNQVAETYGLPDSTFVKIRPYLQITDVTIRTININTCTKEMLSAHPYISWKVAHAIVEYRNQHGNFSSITDLKKIMIIDDLLYQKIHLYCTLD